MTSSSSAKTIFSDAVPKDPPAFRGRLLQNARIPCQKKPFPQVKGMPFPRVLTMDPGLLLMILKTGKARRPGQRPLPKKRSLSLRKKAAVCRP